MHRMVSTEGKGEEVLYGKLCQARPKHAEWDREVWYTLSSPDVFVSKMSQQITAQSESCPWTGCLCREDRNLGMV